MRKFIIILSVVFASILVKGQENKFSIGIEGTIDFYNYFFKQTSGEQFKALPGYNAGYRFQYNINEKLSLHFGILYSMKEYKKDYIYFIISGFPPRTTKLKSYYLNIPFSIGYRVFSRGKLSIYPSVGMISGIFDESKEMTLFYGYRDEEPSDYLNQNLSKFLLSAQLDLGFEYMFLKRLFITIAPYFNYGINKMDNAIMNSNSISYGGMLSINYKFMKKNAL